MTRRQVLAVSAAAAVVAAGGVGGVASQWWNRPADEGYTWLSEEEVSFVEALADALFPPGGQPALAGADAQLSRWFDEVLGTLPPGKAREFKLLLHALDALGSVQGGGRFASQDRTERWRLARSWITSPIPELRGASLGLSTLLGGGYTTHPEVAEFFSQWHGCGYGR